MKNKFACVVLILIAALFFQCQKEIGYTGNPDPGIPVTPNPITATIQGNIFDENDQPAAGVAITAGTSTATTDINGFFHINNASLDKNTSFVSAQKDGYFKAYRVFAATSGCNQVVIKLIKRNLAGTISSSSGGTASLTDGSKINLPANAVVNASSGSDYSGDVKVYAAYINPKSADINKTIPGSLIANDKNGKRVILSSYGMLAVELESSTGEKLQVKAGNVATLTIPIPSSAIASAPSTISLWYIDETTGIWQEEGTANKSGNSYTGMVKHFSFWNCDYPIDAVNLSMTLKLSDSMPLINATVRISTKDSTTSAYGWTDSLGQVKGLVPSNKELQLDVLDQCGASIYTKTISPLTQDADLGVLIIPGSIPNIINFMATLVDCNGNLVKDGYAIINFNGITRYVASNPYGYFYTSFTTCNGLSANFTVLGVDEGTMQQGEEVNVPVTLPVTDAGDIIACGNAFTQQYINFTLDTSQYNVIAASTDTSYIHGSTNISSTYITSNKFDTSNFIEFTATGITTGTFPISSLSVRGFYNITPDPSSTATFTTYATNTGGFYEGSLSAKFTDTLANIHNITGTFKVIRTQ